MTKYLTLLLIFIVSSAGDPVKLTVSKAGDYVRITATNTVPSKPYTLSLTRSIVNPNWLVESTISTRTNYIEWILPIQKFTNNFFQVKG